MSDQETFYRQSWMTDDQWECAQLFATLMRGFHHVGGKFKPSGVSGVEINEPYGHWATFDFDGLTRLVFLAHQNCIRIAISPSGPRLLRFTLHKRHVREGAMHERHPTIMGALMKFYPDAGVLNEIP